MATIGLDPGASSVISMSVDAHGRALHTPLYGAQEDGRPFSAVIAVPAFYDDAQRQALKKEATEKGLEVHRVINAPTAAALAHGLERSEGLVLVYDFGHHLDLTVLELEDGIFEVLETERFEGLGPVLGGARDPGALVDATLQSVDALLGRIGKTYASLTHAILSGGATRHFAVREAFLGRGRSKLLQLEAPELTVAQGAAVLAKILDQDVAELISLDITPLSFGVELEDGRTFSVLARNTTIPTQRSVRFSSATGTKVLSVLRGERAFAKDNELIDRFHLDLAGDRDVQVTFDIDPNGVLRLTAEALGKNGARRSCGSWTPVLPPLSSEMIETIIEDAKRKSDKDALALAAIQRDALYSQLSAVRTKLTETEWSKLMKALQGDLSIAQKKVHATLKEALKMTTRDFELALKAPQRLPVK